MAGAAMCTAMLWSLPGVPGTAWGQRLDLDGSGAMSSIPEEVLDRTEDELRTEIKALERQADEKVVAAGLRLRKMALAMIQAGRGAGEVGSVQVMTGLRLARSMKEAESLFEEVRSGATTDGMRLFAEFLTTSPVEPAQIPRDVGQFDRLMSATFQPLVRLQAGRRGADGLAWPVVGVQATQATAAALDAAIVEAAKIDGVGSGAEEALRHFATSLREDERAGVSPVKLATARQMVVQAVAALTGRPKWLPPKASAPPVAAFDAAAMWLGSPDTRDAAYIELARLALLGEILKAIDTAEFTARQIRLMRGQGTKFAQEIKAGVDSSDDALAAMHRGFGLLAEYEQAAWNNTRRIVREARPAWRGTELAARVARDELIEALSKLSPGTPALSDPAMLGPLGAMRDRLRDGRRICIISEWLSGSLTPGETGLRVWRGEQEKTPEGKLVEPATLRERLPREAGVRLVSLGQQIVRRENEEQALTSIRALGDGLEAWMPIAGEDELAAAAAVGDSPSGKRWRDLSAANADQLARAVRVAREAWLMSWAGVIEKPIKGQAPMFEGVGADRISLLARLVRVMNDAATVMAMMEESEDAAGIRAWPGFTLSAPALEAILTPLRAELRRASGMIANSEYPRLEGSLGEFTDHARVASALARLERAARVQGLTSRSITTELASPPPTLPRIAGARVTPWVWLGELRVSIASICRTLERHAGATEKGEREQVLTVLKKLVADAEQIHSAMQ